MGLARAAASRRGSSPRIVLVGALSHSGRFRAVFCEQMTFGHLAGAVHEILVGLGGTSLVWRVDRMATAVIPGTDRLNPQFAQIAKHYGVDVAVCPAHRPQRKGVVEAAIKFIGGRWWRTAQGRVDARGAAVARHVHGRTSPTDAAGAGAPSASSAPPSRCGRCPRWRSRPRSSLTGSRRAARWSLFETNKYSVPPGYARQPLTVRRASGSRTCGS